MMTFLMVIAFLLVAVQLLAVVSSMRKFDFTAAAEEAEGLALFIVILIIVLFVRGC